MRDAAAQINFVMFLCRHTFWPSYAMFFSDVHKRCYTSESHIHTIRAFANI